MTDSPEHVSKSGNDEAESAEQGALVALVPALLAVERDKNDIAAVLADALIDRTARVSGDAQQVSGRVEFWETAAAMRGVQRDRMTELTGLFSSLGEQLALARSALIECSLWQRDRQRQERQHAEMCHRALGDLLTYFCVSSGYSLANITGRLLGLDGRLHPAMIDHLGTVLPPFSTAHDDWLACHTKVVRLLRRIARAAPLQSQQECVDGITNLARTGAWREIHERRALDFHRRRPQSHGVAGVPMRSMWELDPIGGGWSLSVHGMGPIYTDGLGLAARSTSVGRAALELLCNTTETVTASRDAIFAELLRIT